MSRLIRNVRVSGCLIYKDKDSRAKMWRFVWGRTHDIPLWCKLDVTDDEQFEMAGVYYDATKMSYQQIITLGTILGVCPLEIMDGYEVDRERLDLSFGDLPLNHLRPVPSEIGCYKEGEEVKNWKTFEEN